MSLQIYVPGIRGASLEPLRALGLGDLLDPGASCSAIDVLHNGPDGGSGVSFFWSDESCGVHLDSQIWTPAKADAKLGRDAGSFWLGREKGRPLCPQDLARNNQLPGCPVTLADGQEWLVPIAVRLPHKITLGADGEPVRRIQSRYAAFYAKCEEYLALLRGWKRGGDFAVAGAYSFAVEALSFNYRITRDVADWLDLFTDENLIWTIGATFECQQLDAAAAQKKKPV